MTDRLRVYGWAAIQALFFWCLIYLLCVHYWVCVNWKTIPDESFTVVEQESVDIRDLLANTSVDPSQDEVEELLQNIQSARENTGLSQEDIQSRLSEWQTKLKSWDNDAHFASLVSADSILPEGGRLVQRFQFGRHLRQASLVDLGDVDVMSLFEDSFRQLQTLIDQKTDIQWGIIGALLSGNFPEKQKISEAELEEMLCTSPQHNSLGEGDELVKATGDTDLAEQDISLYVNETDLEIKLETLTNMIQERQVDPKKSLLESEPVQREINESRTLLRNAFTDLASKVDLAIGDLLAGIHGDDYNSTNKCVSQEHVLALVEEGLDAFYRHQDLRTALLHKVMEIEPSAADGLTLNAVLSAGSHDSDLTGPKSINMRRVIDTPLLRNLAVGIDQFLELISGYNEHLDQYMDHLVETSVDVHDSDASSLGRIFVFWVLKKSGQLNVPLTAPIQQWYKQRRKAGHLPPSL